METRIKSNIENPLQLEELFRSDSKQFEQSFFKIHPDIADSKLAEYWKIRLEFKNAKDKTLNVHKPNIVFLLMACLITGFLMKIPQLIDLDLYQFHYFEKNTGLIILFGLSIYSFVTKSSINYKHLAISAAVFAVSFFYINALPSDRSSHSINLAYIHLPLLLWCMYGLIFIDFDTKNKLKRIEFIKHNGDLLILSTIILIAGGILTSVTLVLFSTLDINIESFYLDYIVIIGLVSSPIVATYVIKIYPNVTNKIAPIIANIFSPLVLITLIAFLASIFIAGKDPYNDRDFLIIFNILLIGVMAIIVFSISETSINKKQRFTEAILFNLSIITLLIDLIALSAIVYRLGEYGFTPNRTAVLGSNLLVFGNLVLITIDLYKVNFKGASIKKVETTIASYLPIYTAWTIFVVFALPFIFNLD